MCTADVGIVPFIWLGRDGRTTGDMSRMHTCRNYNKVMDYISRESIVGPDPAKLEKLRPKEDEFVLWDYL